MKKIALFSAIALSALMVGCSSTETRSDNASMGQMKACNTKQADGTQCSMHKMACASCKENKDGKMCKKCDAKMAAMACAKCKEMKDGKMCAKCEAKKAAINNDG